MKPVATVPKRATHSALNSGHCSFLFYLYWVTKRKKERESVGMRRRRGSKVDKGNLFVPRSVAFFAISYLLLHLTRRS